jgi:dissimilatory sulfite reductase related protein
VAAWTKDRAGCLADRSEWTGVLARETATTTSVAIGENRRDAMRFVRRRSDKRQVAAEARFVLRHLKEARRAARNRLFEPFPFGDSGQACKIAEMRRPRTWGAR